jgi:DNA-binding NarL/FixJ family response regulator
MGSSQSRVPAETEVPATTNRRRLRLVLADDHPEILDELQSLLLPDFEIAEVVGDGAALVAAACRLKPDVVVSDVQMPRMRGIDACSQILRDGCCGTAVLLTMHNNPYYVEEALKAGIRGYVLKVDASEELIPAIHAARSGREYFSCGVLTGHRK